MLLHFVQSRLCFLSHDVKNFLHRRQFTICFCDGSIPSPFVRQYFTSSVMFCIVFLLGVVV